MWVFNLYFVNSPYRNYLSSLGSEHSAVVNDHTIFFHSPICEIATLLPMINEISSNKGYVFN